MKNIFTALFPFFVILICGWFYRLYKKPITANETRKTISQLVLNIFLPALFFKIMIVTDFQARLFLIPAVCTFMIFFLTGLTAGFYRLLEKFLGFHFLKEFKGAMILCSSFANVTFLGMPILTSLFGSTGSTVAVFHDVFSTGPLIYSYGALIGLIYSGEATNKDVGIRIFSIKNKKILFKTLTEFLFFPPFIAAILGFLFKISGFFEIPSTAVQVLDFLGKAVSPLMIFCVGLALEIPSTKTDFKKISKILPGIFIKLLVSPVIGYFIYSFFNSYFFNSNILTKELLTPTERAASILEMAMPTMVVTIMLCDRFRLDVKAAAQMIALTTLLSFVTLPFWIYFLAKV